MEAIDSETLSHSIQYLLHHSSTLVALAIAKPRVAVEGPATAEDAPLYLLLSFHVTASLEDVGYPPAPIQSHCAQHARLPHAPHAALLPDVR